MIDLDALLAQIEGPPAGDAGAYLQALQQIDSFHPGARFQRVAVLGPSEVEVQIELHDAQEQGREPDLLPDRTVAFFTSVSDRQTKKAGRQAFGRWIDAVRDVRGRFVQKSGYTRRYEIEQERGSRALDLDALLAQIEGTRQRRRRLSPGDLLDTLLAEIEESDPPPPYTLRTRPDVGIYRLRLGPGERHALTCLVVAGIVEGGRPLVTTVCGCFDECPTSERERKHLLAKANQIGVLSLRRIEGTSDAEVLIAADLLEPLRADAAAAMQREPRVHPPYRALQQQLEALLQAISARGLERAGRGSRAVLDLDALLAEVQGRPAPARPLLDFDALLQEIEGRQRARPPLVSLQQFSPKVRKALEQRQAINRQINGLYVEMVESSDPYPIWMKILARAQRGDEILGAYRVRGTLPLDFLRASLDPRPMVWIVPRQEHAAWMGRRGWFLVGLTPVQSIVLSRLFWSAFKDLSLVQLEQIVRDPGASRDGVRTELGRAFGSYGGGTTAIEGVWHQRRGGSNPRVVIKTSEERVEIKGGDLIDLAMLWIAAEAKARLIDQINAR